MTRYIGKQPAFGNFVKLDAISAVNGQAAYTMQNGGSNFTNYDNVNQFIVSLNGIIQAPTDSFTVSGSTITFASNLVTGDVINFILVLGDVLSIGTPSDNTISTAKIQNTAVNADKLATDAVQTAKIQNDAVTTDKINLISTSSTPSLEAKGTSGQTDGYIQLNCEQNTHGIKLKSPPHSAAQSYTLTFPSTAPATDKFLQTNSSGVLSFADAGGGEKTLLATTTVSSAVSEVVFNSTYFTSTYRDYVLTASQLDVDTDSARVYMRISSDNASSYKTTSDYIYGVYGFENTGGNIGQSGTGAYFEITSTPSSDADSRTTSFKMHIINPLDTSTYFSWYNLGFSHTTADRSNTFHGAGYYNSSAGDAFNAIRIYPSSGNFDQGVFKLYGIN